MGEYAEYGFDQQGWYGMFVACGIWCLADVSSVSPSSEQTVCSDEGLTLETSAKHHIPQATNIPYQPCWSSPYSSWISFFSQPELFGTYAHAPLLNFRKIVRKVVCCHLQQSDRKVELWSTSCNASRNNKNASQTILQCAQFLWHWEISCRENGAV